MIIERLPDLVADWRSRPDYEGFDAAFPDGRLVAEPDERKKAKRYHVPAMAYESRRLGRPLTEEECERFVISE